MARTATQREREKIEEILLGAGFEQWQVDSCPSAMDALQIRADKIAAHQRGLNVSAAKADAWTRNRMPEEASPKPSVPVEPEKPPKYHPMHRFSAEELKRFRDEDKANVLPTIVTLSDVKPTKIEWLWRSYIAHAALSLIDGDPGLGKSTTTNDLAARVTTGAPMPFETTRREPADVIILTGEDHISATVRPKCDAAGADVTRIHVITAMPVEGDPDAPPMLTSADIHRLELAINKYKAKLVIIDPFMAFLDATIDSAKDQDVRRVLRLLSSVAERTGAAIVIVRHLRKSGGPAIYRGGGSIGIIGAARTALLVARDPEDPDLRILAVQKSNLAAMPPALRWRLVDAGGVPRIQWLDVADGVTADDLAAVGENVKSDDDDLVDAAAASLREILKDGPRPTKDVERDVKAMTGAQPRTIERARKLAGVKAVKYGSVWMMALPISATVPMEHGGDGGVDRLSHSNARTDSASSPNQLRQINSAKVEMGHDLAELTGEDGDL